MQNHCFNRESGTILAFRQVRYPGAVRNSGLVAKLSSFRAGQTPNQASDCSKE